MREMLLFGAGASKEAGIPTAYGMTAEIAKEFRSQPVLERHSRVVSFVLGGLLFNRGIQGEDPLTSGVNVEEFFNAIELLADRNTLEAAPFVAAWHTMVDEFDKIQPPSRQARKLQEIIFNSVTEKILTSIPSSLPSFKASNIDRKLESVVKIRTEAAMKGRSVSSSSSDSVGREVGHFVTEMLKNWMDRLKSARPNGDQFEKAFNLAIDKQPRPGEGRVFREVSQIMIRMLKKFVVIEDAAKLNYLRPLQTLMTRQPRLTIASLNYDNCVEAFCHSAALSCDTGIEEWSKTGRFEPASDGVFLLKLHGSIDWQSTDGSSADRPMPHRVITRVTLEELQKESHWPAVIFGHRNKLTAEGPFLDLLRAFQRELASADRLTIVGYSFADVHINVYLSQWLNQNDQHVLRIVDPSFGDVPKDYTDILLRHAKRQFEVVKEPAGVALQKLFGDYDSGVTK